MLKYLKPFVDIAFFKQGPSILPPAKIYIGVAVIFYLLVSFLGFLVSKTPLSYYLPSVLISLCAYLFISNLLLLVMKRPERSRQTFMAIVGSDAIVSTCQLPAIYLMLYTPEESLGFQIGQLSFLLSLFWAVAVIAVIINEALEWQAWMGYVVSFVLFVALVFIGQMMFPDLGAA